MNVGQLLELLEDVDPETELRIAHQPSWPLCLTVSAVRAPGDDFLEEVACPDHPDYCVGHIISKADEDLEDGFVAGEVCESEPDEDPRDRRQHVWIVGIDHPWDESPYAPRWVFDE